MVTYTVHEPPTPGADRIDRGTELEFVKDGFSWLTAICPPLGYLAMGAWPAAVAYVIVAGVLGWGLTELKVDPNWIGLIVFMLNVYLGFEASTVKRWMLDSQGWTTLAVVNGQSIADCERRFFENWLPTQPIIGSGSTGDGGQAHALPPRRGSRFWPFGAGA